MSTNLRSADGSPAFVRLFTPPVDDPSEPFTPRVSPEMTLREFFELWYLPVVLAGERGASAGTATVYRDALAWWKTLTGDPPLRLIDGFTVAKFQAGLREATFTRGFRGSPRKLGDKTQHKHLRQIRALLAQTGSSGARLIDPPRIKTPKITFERKPTISLLHCRRLFEAAGEMLQPFGLPITPAQWWQGFLGALFVTGARVGTVWGLEWEMLAARGDAWVLTIPARLVPKTKKPAVLYVPAWWAQLVHPWREHAVCRMMFQITTGRILRTIQKDWRVLQTLAGIPEPEQVSLQAWRRTHAREMAALGLGVGMEVAQRALQHSDAETTRDHYYDLADQLRPQLPNLLPAADGKPPSDGRQLMLF